MTQNSFKSLIVKTNETDFRNIPRTEDANYLILIDDGWPLTASVTLDRCIPILGKTLRRHQLIIPGQDLRAKLRVLLECELDGDPNIIITSLHPSEFEKAKKESFIKISIGNFESSDEVVRFLRNIVKLIESDNYLKKIKSANRLILLKGLLKKFSFGDAVGIISLL